MKQTITAKELLAKISNRYFRGAGLAKAEWLMLVDAKDFCKKIVSLDLDIPAEYECSYESIRKICTLSFMDCDARRMDIVRVSKNDQGMFSQCREIALKLAEELGNSYLPQE